MFSLNKCQKLTNGVLFQVPGKHACREGSADGVGGGGVGGGVPGRHQRVSETLRPQAQRDDEPRLPRVQQPVVG